MKQIKLRLYDLTNIKPGETCAVCYPRTPKECRKCMSKIIAPNPVKEAVRSASKKQKEINRIACANCTRNTPRTCRRCILGDYFPTPARK